MISRTLGKRFFVAMALSVTLALGCLPAGTAIAAEADMQPYKIGKVDTAFPVDPSLAVSEVPFALVYLPLDSWQDISAHSYPDLYRVLQQAAIGNLVSDDSFISQEVAERPNISKYNLEGLSARAANDVIADLVPESLEQGVLVLVGSSVFEREEAVTALTPVVVVGGGFDGYLTSSTTRRSGLITASDILYFERQLNTPNDSPVTTPNLSQTKTIFDLTGLPTSQPLKDRLSFLQHNIDIVKGVDATNRAMNLVLLTLFLLTAAFSLVLLFLEIDVNPRYVRILVPLNRGFLLIMLSFPIACFLMFLIPPPLYPLTDTAGGLVGTCLIWTALLVTVALLIGRIRRWVHSLLFLFVVTFCVLVADQLLGGPLTLTGYLNYKVNGAVRYYGLGNEAAALLFGSWITFSGMVVNRFANSPLLPAFKRWLFLLVSVLIILICALPTIGASFGVLVWGVMGVAMCWWLFGGRAITLRFLLIAFGLCVVLAIGTLIADIYFNPYSHMNHIATALEQGPLVALEWLFTSILASSLQTVTYSPLLTLAFALVVLWLLVLAVVKPGTYREFWVRNLGFRAAYAAGLGVVFIMLFLEDSGIYMPALYIVYLLAGFIWLVCDMQTWRARESIASGAHIPVRELLALALERENYSQLGQGKELQLRPGEGNKPGCDNKSEGEEGGEDGKGGGSRA
ncbi:MAG: hypothetical protein LBU07_07005 [Coriobacteriales bacterium]|jgi:hypothetical protein|nr:hypothetical protein [Coriobacteriales bacterium]